MKEYTVKVYSDGGVHWFLNGKRHREDGPAAQLPDGSKHWFLDGKWVTEEQHGRIIAQHNKRILN